MGEIRQVIDGAFKLDDGGILYIIATTNKNIKEFPQDLLHRVLLHVHFDKAPPAELPFAASEHGFDRQQCMDFWRRNALCLKDEEILELAKQSEQCVPRELQLWVQKVLIE